MAYFIVWVTTVSDDRRRCHPGRNRRITLHTTWHQGSPGTAKCHNTPGTLENVLYNNSLGQLELHIMTTQSVGANPAFESSKFNSTDTVTAGDQRAIGGRSGGSGAARVTPCAGRAE